MTDRAPDAIDIENAELRWEYAREIAGMAADLRDRIAEAARSSWLSVEAGSEMPDPLTLDVHAILHAALEAAEAPLERAAHSARTELAYLTGKLKRPETEDETKARPHETTTETRRKP